MIHQGTFCYCIVIYVTVDWFKQYLLEKKVTLTYFKPENSPRKEDLVTARQKKIT